ncbi:MAG: hypothetical protein SFV19_13760 [Rhodospirillaceae bacterium]|nr:hypothetical protein [Rhodospirillaceae bacterium]
MTQRRNLQLVCGAIAALGLGACAERDHFVVAATSTVIGVSVGQTPSSTAPEAKLGYNRAELAVVPTNRGTCVKQANGTYTCTSPFGNGAKDTTDVLMELNYGGGLLAGSKQGIYQRLAVGNDAVKQAGASVMFAKDTDGKVDSGAARALQDAQFSQELAKVYGEDIKTLEKARAKGANDFLKSQGQARTVIEKIAGADAADETAVNPATVKQLATAAGVDQSRADFLATAKDVKTLKAYLSDLPDEIAKIYQHIIK